MWKGCSGRLLATPIPDTGRGYFSSFFFSVRCARSRRRFSFSASSALAAGREFTPVAPSAAPPSTEALAPAEELSCCAAANGLQHSRPASRNLRLSVRRFGRRIGGPAPGALGAGGGVARPPHVLRIGLLGYVGAARAGRAGRAAISVVRGAGAEEKCKQCSG